MRQSWKTLETPGPLFPENYAPKGFKLDDAVLSPLAEEMLWAYAPFFVNNSDHVKKPQFYPKFYSCL